MTMKVECYFCGDDCSNAHASWHGYPCHIMCIPTKREQERKEHELAAEYESDLWAQFNRER